MINTPQLSHWAERPDAHRSLGTHAFVPQIPSTSRWFCLLNQHQLIGQIWGRRLVKHSVFHLKYTHPEPPVPETLDDLPHCLSVWAGALDTEESTNKNAYPRDNNVESFPSGHEHVKSAPFLYPRPSCSPDTSKSDVTIGSAKTNGDAFSISRGIVFHRGTRFMDAFVKHNTEVGVDVP